MPAYSTKSSSASPICSICIANYNGIGVIEDCIKAVLNQDADFSFEIIIHDDASTDGSVAYIRHNHPDVKLIASEQNVGFCVSNNRMVSAASGKFILLLNNDAVLMTDALRTLYEYACGQPTPGILGLPQYDAASGKLLDLGSFCDPFLNSIPNFSINRSSVAMIAGACLWVPIDLWQRIGGFPDWFHTLGEDLYFCSVARLWGYQIKVIPHSGFRHWVGKTLGGGKIEKNRLSTSMRRRALTERNKTFVMILCPPAFLPIILLPIHLFLLMLEGIILSIAKRDFALWKNIYYPIIPSLWQKRNKLHSLRREIQSRRSISIKAWLRPFRFWPYKLAMLLKHGLPEVR